MNAEALNHAARCCRKAAQGALRDADEADVLLHRCPNSGRGMRSEAHALRENAVGLRVAGSFISRCAKFPEIEQALHALESGHALVVSEHRAVGLRSLIGRLFLFFPVRAGSL